VILLQVLKIPLANWRIAGPSQAAIRRELAEEEARNIANGNDLSLHEQVTPSVLISAGIDIEAEQCVVLHYTIHSTNALLSQESPSP